MWIRDDDNHKKLNNRIDIFIKTPPMFKEQSYHQLNIETYLGISIIKGPRYLIHFHACVVFGFRNYIENGPISVVVNILQ